MSVQRCLKEGGRYLAWVVGCLYISLIITFALWKIVNWIASLARSCILNILASAPIFYFNFISCFNFILFIYYSLHNRHRITGISTRSQVTSTLIGRSLAAWQVFFSRTLSDPLLYLVQALSLHWNIHINHLNHHINSFDKWEVWATSYETAQSGKQ